MKQRFPIITQQPQHGGQSCPQHVVNGVPDEAHCNLGPCARKPDWSFMYIILHLLNHSMKYPANNTAVFFSDPCEWKWGDYGDCSKSCGTGTKTRYPIITVPARHGGFCPAHVLSGDPDTADCNTNPCPGE